MWRHYTASTFDHCMSLYKRSAKRSAEAGYRGHGRISFVLTEGLAIKRIASLDAIKDEVTLRRYEDERFDAGR